MSRVGLIILAAGGSTRLGRPKQLLSFRGRSLILHAACTALDTTCRPVVVVVGADSERIGAELAHVPVLVAENPKWELGLGSSIQAGLSAVTDTDAVLLMLSDQPLIQSSFLQELVRTFEIHGGIVASAYDNTLGVPAIFGKDFYPELGALAPNQGAKCIMQRHSHVVRSINCAAARIDVDTQQDYDELMCAT